MKAPRLILACAAWALLLHPGLAPGQVTLTPPSTNVVAGELGRLTIGHLATNPAAPASFNIQVSPTNLAIAPSVVVQGFDPGTGLYATNIRVDVNGLQPGAATVRVYSDYDELFSTVNVLNPTLTFDPTPAAVNIGQTVPLIVRRTAPGRGVLQVQLQAGGGFGVGLQAGLINYGSSLSIQFGALELEKTVYLSGLAMADLSSSLIASVGTYQTSLTVQVTGFSGATLTPVFSTLTAGNKIALTQSGLPTSTNNPPCAVYFESEDSGRVYVSRNGLAAPGDLFLPPPPVSMTQTLVQANNQYVSSLSCFLYGVQPLAGATPDPVPIHAVVVQGGFILWTNSSYITVTDPTFSFVPAAPAVRVGETIPVSIRRTIEANGPLTFRVASHDPSLMGLGTNAVALQTNGSLTVSFDAFEISKTIYVSGLALAQHIPTTNVILVAQVGSYASNVAVLVSTNAGLILTPAPVAPATNLTVAAGDTLTMTVTRNGANPLSDLLVELFSGNPDVLDVPAAVTIPAGAAGVSFPVRGLKPGSAFVRASALGVEPGPDSLRTVAVNSPNLTFEPDPVSLAEREIRSILIHRPATEAGGELTITLNNNSPSVFSLLSETVTIPAGYAAAAFSIRGTYAGEGTLSARVGGYQKILTVTVTAVADEDDLDGDGMPDWWEVQYFGDNTVADDTTDFDGDELLDREEYIYGTNPLRQDTDDDGVNDNVEIRVDITSPLHPMSSRLYHERSLDLAAVPGAGLVAPDATRFHFGTNGWTVECWIYPGADGTGTVFSLEGVGAGQSFRVGLEDHRPKAEILSGVSVIASAGGVGPAGSIQRLPTNEWTHVAWAWGPQDNSLKIYVNGVLLIAQETLVSPNFVSGTGVLAQAFNDGYLDEVRIWNYARSWEEVDYWHQRYYPAPAGYVPLPVYGQSLRLAYRFDDGGSNTVDFAFLNQTNYFLLNTATMVTNDPAVALLGRDDEDGDLLPEWWARVHNLDQYPEIQVGPNFEYFDSQAQGLARVSYFRSFRAYGSVGNVVGWSQDADNQFHSPKDQGLGHDGRYSTFLKYIYLYSVPKTATLQIFTPGMESTIAYVNGQQVTSTGQVANAQQNLDVAGQLKIGRNMIYVRCVSQFDRWLDEFRIQPVIVPPTVEHYERAIGKFDARLVVDGVEAIVRGDTSRNDPRAVWFVQTWSTFWHMMFAGGGDPTAPDLENRFAPGNQDYGLPFDADTDSLNAWYEYLVGTNPRDDDSNNNGIPDGLEDHDGDGLVNRDEQDRGIHPLLPDTDDDGIVDGIEAALGDDPASARSPAISRALSFNGADEAYAEMPMQRRFALDNWTLEAWVRLNAGESNGCVLLQRQVGPNGVNYEMGLDSNNVPYVRYVSVDGLVVQATGQVAFAAGTNWTHLAGTYDDYRRELKLYTNGTLVGEAPLALQSPAIYAGGPVLQRIGAGLDGDVDDLRIWSVVRSEEDLAATYNKALQGSELNLVAYYRADDGTSFRDSPLIGTSANNGTNGTVAVKPWAWGQVQDYVRAYSGDWWEKWTHAATLRSDADFSGPDTGAIPIPPSLRVTLVPPEAVAAGAQWAALGIGSWQNSGTTLYEDLVAGSQTILFKTVYGWTAPSNRVVGLTNGVTTSITESYIQNGSLRVEISFDDQNNHSGVWPVTGAQWRVSGGIWRDSGATLDNMTPGSYVVEFKAIAGWSQPAPVNVTILPGSAYVLLRQYVPATAAVRVLIEPSVAAIMGAQWRLDSGPWQNSGDILSGVVLGGHLVSFSDVPPWVTPGGISVDLTSTNLVAVTGRYEQVTGLYVQIAPPQAVAAGAQWRVNGGSWHDPIDLVPFDPGNYTVEFKPLPGWGQAPNVHTAVTSGYTTVISASYNPEDPDNDGLSTDWELYIGSDPYDAYSLDPADLLNDGEWDSDGDDLSNYEEVVIYGTDPLRVDTDDDGVEDGTEVRADLTHPLHPMSSRLYHERSLNLAAAPTNGLVLPDPARFRVRVDGWTLEAWLRPGTDGDGKVFSLEGGSGGQRFWAGLEDHRPIVRLLSGTNTIAVAGGVGPEGSIQRLPTNEWTHVAWVWAPQDNSLEIFINGVLLIAQETLVAPDFSGGTGILARAFTDGYLDEVRFWNYDRSWEEIDYWGDRFVPAPSGYVLTPEYGQPLVFYYRFDDGGSNTVDFVHLNDPNYFLPDTASWIVTNPAVSLLGRDDEDGDLLPEWWTTLHGLDSFTILTNFGPALSYYDASSDPPNVARVAFYRAAQVYGSVGGYTTWLDQEDHMWYSPKSELLGWDGRYSTYLKYVYMHKVPQTATLRVHTPGMAKTIVYVNGVRVSLEAEENGQDVQTLDISGSLRIGRNAIYVYCESTYTMYLDEERTQLTTDPQDAAWWEGIKGKFDAELTCDGQPVIVRGDHGQNDPRAVWFAQAWSTYIDQSSDPPLPDLEMRALPGNPDYGLPFDADTDSLNAWYEYLVGTNPRDDDSNNNGIPDGLEDHDGDGLVNRDEQDRGIHPLLPDTDDDGIVDGIEAALGDDPASARSPAISRALSFNGADEAYAEMPMQRRFALDNWTLEAWVRLNAGESNGCVLLQRQVGPNGVNYEMGLDSNNVPYVRYVSVDGLVVQATGQVAFAAGTNWTHLAGTYDDYRRELKLYTNGTLVGEAPLALQSPAIYAGGPVLQRIGAGLDGDVDDLRIWSVVRSEEDLAATYNKALQGSELNLVAYYRADDGTSFRDSPLIGTSANNGTNGTVAVKPWAWGQVQDYVRAYSGDWWEKWTHAATLRSDADFSGPDTGAIPIPPSLRVTLVPPEAVAAGAQWAALGIGSWQNSGTTLYEDLVAGSQTILFKTVYGWTAPSNRVVGLTNGVTTSITESYIQNGSLRVEISFDDQNNHSGVWPVTGAQWRVSGGIWRDSGATLDNMTPGSYVVEFKAIAGWSQPAPVNVTILPGSAYVLLRQYVPATAAVRVLIEPSVAAIMGAQWRLDSGPWQNSGDILSGVVLGGHLVSFSDVPPWVTPGGISVDLTSTNLVAVTGRYEQVTGLYVQIAPPQAVAAGAQWRVNGGSWHDPIDLVPFDPGNYTVEFKPLPGWGQAPNVHTAVTSGYTTVISASYNPEDPDNDGLSTDWELYIGSDPYDAYSLDPADLLNDGEWDSDGDDLSNYEEVVIYGTDPLRVDTDDDGVEDGTEVRADLTHPLHPMSSRLYHERSLNLAAAPTNGLVLPDPARFRVRVDGWTLEAWLRPGTDGDGKVFSLEGGSGGQRFWAGLEDHRPIVRLLSGTNTIAVAGGVGPEGSIQRLPTNEWTHVAWVWAPQDNSLEIFINGVLLIAQETLVAPDFSGGTGILARAFTDGYLDEVRFWNYDRSWEEIDYWGDRFVPAPSGYVLTPEYGQPLVFYYRFDDGGSNTVDFVHLNDPNYFLPDTASWIVTNPAVSLLGRDDEDGDLLPEWWTTLHGLDSFTILTNFGPALSYYDASSDPPNVARVAFYRAAQVYGSVGGYTTWLDQEDHMWYSPKSELLGWDGRYSTYLKYVYMHKVPQTATLRVHTPGMAKTIVYVNGVRVSLEAEENGQDVQTLDISGSLRIGRNAIYVYCESTYTMYLDEERTQLTTDPQDAAWWEGIKGKFDAELTCDGQPVIVRGDHGQNDPRAVWFAQAWSTYIDQSSDPPLPDLEMRALPGNPDYGLPFDTDTDGFNAWYEYLCGTNPRDDDSNNNGVPDGLEDFDGDGLVNGGEQERGTHPLLPDADDDGGGDGAEVAAGHDPADAQSPAVSRALRGTGGTNDYAEMPMQRRFALNHWTVEAWVQLDPAESNGGVLFQRAVGPTNGVNYELGLGDGVTAGVNVPYIRYVSVEGFMVQATSTVALATGTNWTHLAGTYDGFQRELKLYTNGGLAAVAPQALQPPAIYAGGPVRQRIGAGLNGRVDDLRLWDLPRSEDDISTSFKKPLQGNEPGLVAYYRADDSTSYRTNPLVGASANNGTNGTISIVPWTWGQVQDYVIAYSGDWWEQWTHAASLRGAMAFTGDGEGALVIPPSLRVILLPPEVVATGAQWAVQDVSSWLNSGATLYTGLTEGTNIVLFKSVYGWTAPSNLVVILSNGVQTVISATYLRNGSLRVDLTFQDEATHGALWPTTNAQWRVSGGSWRYSGETITNMSPGNYTIEFKPLDGWSRPANIDFTLLPAENAVRVGQYVPATALLRVWIEPDGVVTQGAQWRLDAGAWNNSGDILPSVRVGEHTVHFSDVQPWITPASIDLQMFTTNPVVVTGRYVEVTGIYVEILPSGAVASGAQWRVAGGPWTNSGNSMTLPSGDYTVEFSAVPGWGQAPSVPTAVTNQKTTRIQGLYWPMEVYGPPGDTNAVLTLYLNEPRGLAFDPLRRLHIADSKNHRIVILDTRDLSVTNLGDYGTTAGQFNQPFGVVLDRSTNLYVVDTGNHRVQKRTPAGAWTVWGGTGFGTNAGQFHTPYDAAVDSFTNLYITDRDNHRVQKRTPAGVWSTFVSNGIADAYVYLAKGVTVDASNQVVVSDYQYPSEQYSRIQLFATNSVFLGRIGSSTNTEGGLNRPQRMAFGMTNDLYVADMNNNRIVRRSEPGNWQTLLGENVLNHPEGVAWDPRGYLYIADTMNHRVLRLRIFEWPQIPPSFSTTLPGPGGVTISWLGAPGWFYTVQYTDSLIPANWLNVSGGAGLPGLEGPMSCTDTNNTGIPGRIYRVLAY